MFSKIAIAASLASGAYALTVASPAALVQCQPVQLSWGEGVAPYYISVIPGGQPSAAALVSFPTQTGNSITWTVDQPAGSEITIKVVDSTGDTNYSSQVPIQAGSTTECSNSGSGAAAGGSSAASAPASSAADDDDDESSSAAPRATSSRIVTSTAAAGARTSSVSSSSSSGSASPIGAAGNAAMTSPAASTPTGAAAPSFKAGVSVLAAVAAAAVVALSV